MLNIAWACGLQLTIFLSISDAALPRCSSWVFLQYLGDGWHHPPCQSAWQSMIVAIYDRLSRWILGAVKSTDRWDRVILTDNLDSRYHSSSFTWVCHWFNGARNNIVCEWCYQVDKVVGRSKQLLLPYRIHVVGVWSWLSRHIRRTAKSQVPRLSSAVFFRLTWSLVTIG